MSFTASHKRRLSSWAAAVCALVLLSTTASNVGAAVVLSIPQTYSVAPGGTVNVSVNLDTTGEAAPIDIIGINLAIQYDDLIPTPVFTISNIVKGGLLDPTWTLIPNTTNPGILLAAMSAGSPSFQQSIAPNTIGSVLTFDLTLDPGATDSSYPVNLLANYLTFQTSVEDTSVNNILTTLPTNAPNDPVDGLISNAIPEPSQYALTGMLVGLAGLRQLWIRRRARAAKV